MCSNDEKRSRTENMRSFSNCVLHGCIFCFLCTHKNFHSQNAYDQRYANMNSYCDCLSSKNENKIIDHSCCFLYIYLCCINIITHLYLLPSNCDVKDDARLATTSASILSTATTIRYEHSLYVM